MGVRYAGLWGVAAGMLNCIPYFGPTVIMVTSAVAAMLQFNSASMVALVAGDVARDHVARRIPDCADRVGPRRQRQLRRRLRRGDVLGLDVGLARPDPRRPGADDRQDRSPITSSRCRASASCSATERLGHIHCSSPGGGDLQMEATYTLSSAERLVSRLPAPTSAVPNDWSRCWQARRCSATPGGTAREVWA